MLINFSDPMVAERFDAKICTWAFGMNLFDLHEGRRQNLTALYHKYQQMVWISCFEGCLCIFLHTIFSTCCASLSQISRFGYIIHIHYGMFLDLDTSLAWHGVRLTEQL